MYEDSSTGSPEIKGAHRTPAMATTPGYVSLLSWCGTLGYIQVPRRTWLESRVSLPVRNMAVIMFALVLNPEDDPSICCFAQSLFSTTELVSSASNRAGRPVWPCRKAGPYPLHSPSLKESGGSERETVAKTARGINRVVNK